MGGYGSGKQGGRATVEGCQSLALDINRVIRPVAKALRGRDLPGDAEVRVGRRWWWTRHSEAEPWAEVEVALNLYREHGFATLRYNVEHWSRRTGPQAQRVQIVSTPCRFGGRRWWWLCPATGRRCAKLYLPNGGTLFLSRGPGAYRLAYVSQNGSAMDRSHGRLARLHRKLGGDYGHCDDPLPARPKWMRRRTYERLWAEWETTLDRHEAIFEAGAARILARESRLHARRTG
jgi:hypothetical protein